jgi:hypothetical protein
MAIKKYEFNEITPIIKEMFPTKPCNDISCRFNMNSFGNFYTVTSGLLSGNNYALNQFKKLAKGNYGSSDNDNDDLDFLSPSKFVYYNPDKKEY